MPSFAARASILLVAVGVTRVDVVDGGAARADKTDWVDRAGVEGAGTAAADTVAAAGTVAGAGEVAGTMAGAGEVAGA